MQLISESRCCPTAAQQTTEAIRNSLGRAMRQRAAESGVPALVLALRAHDSDGRGSLTKPALRAAMLRLGLRVDDCGNLDRAWGALTQRDDGGGGGRVPLDRLICAVSGFEAVPPRLQYHVRR